MDASGIGIGAILMQSNHPIAYLSKATGPRYQGTLGTILISTSQLIAKAKDSWMADHKLQKTVDNNHMTPQPCKQFTFDGEVL